MARGSLPACNPQTERSLSDGRLLDLGGYSLDRFSKRSLGYVPPTFTEPGHNLHTPEEICIDRFQADHSPTGVPHGALGHCGDWLATIRDAAPSVLGGVLWGTERFFFFASAAGATHRVPDDGVSICNQAPGSHAVRGLN
jgi:hypothetical protein